MGVNFDYFDNRDGDRFSFFMLPKVLVTDEAFKGLSSGAKILNELDSNTGGIGLIERKRQGLGKPNIIYVKDFMSIFKSECNNYTSEVNNLHRSNTYNNNLNYSNTDFSKGKGEYGTFQNVFLTDDEVVDIKEILMNQFDNYIERLSTYIKSIGKTYKDHKATILSWFYKDQGNQNQKKNTKNKSYSLEDTLYRYQ